MVDSKSAPQATIISTPASSAARAVKASNAVTRTIFRFPLRAIRSATVSFVPLGLKGAVGGGNGSMSRIVSMKPSNSSSLSDLRMLCLFVGYAPLTTSSLNRVKPATASRCRLAYVMAWRGTCPVLVPRRSSAKIN